MNSFAITVLVLIVGIIAFGAGYLLGCVLMMRRD